MAAWFLLLKLPSLFAGIDSCVVVSVGGSRTSAPSLCGEHGHCVNQPGVGYKCQCQPGYTGKYCHESKSLPPMHPSQSDPLESLADINDCKVNPCENGGTCVDKVNAFQCICNEGWEGALCNIDTDDCNPTPCRNNGTCVDGIADFECECTNGWKGKTCSLKDSHCDHTTCKNGGTCQDLGNTFICRCPPDWEGKQFEIDSIPSLYAMLSSANRYNVSHCETDGLSLESLPERWHLR